MCHIKIRSHTTRDYIYTPGWPRYDPVQLTKKKKKRAREREREKVYTFLKEGFLFFSLFRLKKTGNIATVIYLSDGRINQT